MTVTDAGLRRAEIKPLIGALAFVGEFGIRIVDDTPGAFTMEMPFAERFSGPPGSFPTAVVGAVGDIAAVSSCLSLLPLGWAAATLDFTVKMTGPARGDRLRAVGRVLQNGRTTSVASAEIYAVTGDDAVLCGAVLATTRNFEMK